MPTISDPVRLFQWDEKDPILSTWMASGKRRVEAVFADLAGPPALPQRICSKVQRDLLTSYHVRDAYGFYTGGDRGVLLRNLSQLQLQMGHRRLP